MGSMRIWIAAIFGGVGAFAIFMFFRNFVPYHVLIPWHLTAYRPVYPLEPLLLGAFGGAFGVALLWSYYRRGLIQVAATFVGGIAGYLAGLATFAYVWIRWPLWLQNVLP